MSQKINIQKPPSSAVDFVRPGNSCSGHTDTGTGIADNVNKKVASGVAVTRLDINNSSTINGIEELFPETHTPVEDPTTVQFQLVPYSIPPAFANLDAPIDRNLNEGEGLRIGRFTTNPKGLVQDSSDIFLTSKVVSRIHGELWVRDGTLFLKDIGSSSGTFLNLTRLSPPGKESRPYPLREGDIITFGVDYKDKTDPSLKAITVQLKIFDSCLNIRTKINADRFKTALKNLLDASNPHAAKNRDNTDVSSTECCICIGETAPYQALFIAPCSHCFHYKCVTFLLNQSVMFQCPLCRQVANLAASVSCDSINLSHIKNKTEKPKHKEQLSKHYTNPDCPEEAFNELSDGLQNKNDDAELVEPEATKVTTPQKKKRTPFSSKIQNLFMKKSISKSSNNIEATSSKDAIFATEIALASNPKLKSDTSEGAINIDQLMIDRFGDNKKAKEAENAMVLASNVENLEKI